MTLAKKSRNVNLDLLRIVSMILIVFLHSIDHSGVLENAENCSIGMRFYVQLTYALCMVCVNLYIMLSGYFMIDSRFRLHKLVTLWMEVVFYSFVLKLAFMLVGKESLSLTSLASCFLPITTGRYWFLTIYVGMYLIAPFMNTLIRGMSRRQHSLLNIVLFGIMSIWVSIHPGIAGMNTGGGWGLAWFVVLYLAAAWLRLYYTPSFKAPRYFIACIALPCIIALARVVFGGGTNVLVQRIIQNWFRYDSAPVYVMTVCLFVGFLNIRILSERFSALIVAVAPLTLGVYLIHAHANVSPWSWEVLNLPAKMNTALFPFIQLGSVLGIFVICAAIEVLRKNILGRLENSRLIKNTCDQIQTKVNGLIDRFFKE